MACREPIFRKDRYNNWVPTPCKMCLLCRNQRREEWTQRLQLEYVANNYIGSFITLTYRDDTLPLLYPLLSAVPGSAFHGHLPPGTLYQPDIRQFYKVLNERMFRKYGYRPKHVLVGEYGETEYRPHWHGIIIGLPNNDRDMVYQCWNKGRIDIAPVTHADIRYTLSYIDKQIFIPEELYEAYGDFTPPFCNFSNGIGDTFYKLHQFEFDEFGRYWFSSDRFYQLSNYYLDKYGFKKPNISFSKKTWDRFCEDNPQYYKYEYDQISELFSSASQFAFGGIPQKDLYNKIMFYQDKVTELSEMQIRSNAHRFGRPTYNIENLTHSNLTNPDFDFNIDLGSVADYALALQQ